MQTKPPLTVRHGKSLVEAITGAVRAIKETHPNAKYHVAFSFMISPAPSNEAALTDSETLSWLDAFKGALSKFRNEEPAVINVDILPESPIKTALEEHTDTAFRAVLALEEPGKKIVTPLEALKEAKGK